MDPKNLKTSNRSHESTCGYVKCSKCSRGRPLSAQYIDTASASTLTGLSPRALDTLRYRGTGPRYLRIGRRIRYRVNDLLAWMERDAVPASDPEAAPRADERGGNNG